MADLLLAESEGLRDQKVFRLNWNSDQSKENGMPHVFLKIKLKSLAEEARIIHAQERKTGGPKHDALRESLHRHRIYVVRRASRETHLAYGFLRGRSYKQMEAKCDRPPDWKAVMQMVKKYGYAEIPEAWKAAS